MVAGFSFGGMVAQTLAIEHREDVSALVASACGSTLSEEARAAVRGRGVAARQGGMQAVVESTLERWFTPEFRARGGDAAARERLLRDDADSWAQTWDAIAGLNTGPRLGELTMPTLCLAAEKDASVSAAAMETMAKAIPAATFEVLRGLPHMLFIEDPRGVAAAMDGFLQNI
jgi:pimeloyl-ACP methyl ester carboxylesterase